MLKELSIGIHHNISAEDYHSLPYLGSSTLKRFKSNPYESRQPFSPTPSMELGTAIHLLALEGSAAFDAEYYLSDIPCPEDQNPKGWKKTTKYKEAFEVMSLENAGKKALTKDQFDAVMTMLASLRNHPTSSVMLNRGANEVTVIWRDHATGIMCKARPDDFYNGVASDLKSCSDIEKFHRDVYYRHYEIQAQFYTNGLEACGEEVKAFCFIGVQSGGTNPVRCGYLSPESMEKAKHETARLMGLYKECSESNIWPNYAIPQHIHSLSQLTPADLLEVW